MHIRNILVPIDFSDHSLHALRIASGMITGRGGLLHLLHVWQAVAVFTESSPPAVVLAAQEEAARSRLQQMATVGNDAMVRRYLGTGAPADEILRFAETRGADLIVMGTYGMTGSTPWALGSVAEAVVRRAACPVLTCKLPSPLALRHAWHAGDGAARSREPVRPTTAPPEEV